MKKNTVKLFMLAILLGSGAAAHSQTRKAAKAAVTEIEASNIKKLANELKRETEAKYNEAVRLAEINNWPLEIKRENGRISTLREVRNGFPFYVTNSNVGSAITSRTNHLQPGGSLNLNLTGLFDDGDVMMIGVWDGGHARITHNDLLGRLNPGDNSQENYHPTHVTGTIIGNGSSAPASKGMASEAYVTMYDWNFDSQEMETFALGGGLLSNHSYGTDPDSFGGNIAALEAYRGTYDNTAREIDKVTFSAPYYQPVVAAGNEGDGQPDRLTDMSVSKNAITVAAVEEVNNYTDENSVVAASFTSYGPTNDKRIKPDIATKGTSVYSTSDASNNAHSYEQGTSMATPGITGSLALLQQYYAKLHSTGATKTFMRSSTVRALVAHSADEAGVTDGPDNIYGWGLMNSKRAAEILKADHDNGSANVQELILTPGSTYTYNVTASGAEPLIATLAWTDPAANATADGASTVVLVNNLDIKVTKGTQAYYPWRLVGDGGLYYALNDGANSVDNIEKVEIPNATGNYTITISHKKTTLVNPTQGEGPQQAYSLIVSGINGTPAGVEDFSEKMFSIWPNPANDILNISFVDGVEKDATATIYDMQGRLVRAVALKNADNELNVQDLSGGIYVVSVTNGAKTGVQKVVIK